MSCVSCIITTHNREELLPGAIRSVIKQTYSDIEIIIVDDNSKDRTSEVISEFVDRDERIIALDANKGTPMGARNVGIKAASGEYIAFLDDDDRWDPEKIEKQIQYIDDYSAISCICRIIKPNAVSIQNHDFTGISEQNLDQVFRGIRHLYPSGTMVPTEYVQGINGFNEDLPEWDFYIRLVKNYGPAAIHDKPLVDFNRENINRVSEQQRDYIGQFEVFYKHQDLVSKTVRRERLGNLYYLCYRMDDRTSFRLLSVLKSIYHKPEIGIKISKNAATYVLKKLK